MHHQDLPVDLFERMVALRREIHRHPELAFQEEQTAQVILRELEKLRIPFSYGGTGTGVIATLGESGPMIALRADMDALPGEESTGLPYASTIEGRMHACGHDAHVAMVLGAANLLAASPPRGVRVRFLFQPAEEKGGGARTVIAAGGLDGVSAVYGAHVTHHYRVGEIMVSPGVITAQSDRFTIRVHGRGGHGARPHEATDAVVITGLLITALQTLVSREIDPVHPSVITIGRVEAGSAPNVIAETAHLEGSIRTTVGPVREHLHSGIRRMARALGELHNAALEVEIQPGYPPVVNTRDETAVAERAARQVVGEGGVVRQEHPSMGSEDFAYYLEKVPGCYVRFGARPEGAEYVPLHSPAFSIDEGVLRVGAAFFEQVARQTSRGGPAPTGG